MRSQGWKHQEAQLCCVSGNVAGEEERTTKRVGHVAFVSSLSHSVLRSSLSLSLSPLSFSCSSFTGMTIWIAPFSLTIPLSICRRSSLLAYSMHSAAAAAATTWSSCWRLMYQTSTASIAHRWDSRFQLPLPATLRNDAASFTSPGIINQRHNPLI